MFFFIYGDAIDGNHLTTKGLQLAIQLSNNYPAVPEVHRESLVFEVNIFLFIVEPKNKIVARCYFHVDSWVKFFGREIW